MPPSGGLSYHYLALRFSRTLWRPFRGDVARWLAEWAPRSRELVIFGSSAGYSLPAGFLARFERVIIVEPDPLARLLLRRRFPRARFEFSSRFSGGRDLLAPIPESEPGSTAKKAVEKLKTFLGEYPNAAVLFANVIGQLPLEFPHLSDELFASHLVAIRAAVQGRPWASYHDLLSTWARPRSFEPFELPAGPLDVELFARAHLEPAPTAGRASRLNVEITDHQTHAFSVGEPTGCAWWELAPGRYHLIGFVRSRGAAPRSGRRDQRSLPSLKTARTAPTR